MRNGNVVLAPILSFSNFVMISYLAINEIVPIWLFAPMFLVAIVAGMVFVGNMFRKKQLHVDMDLNYEKASAAGYTVYQMMSAQKKIMDHLNIQYPDGFQTRLDYMKLIGERKT